MKKNILSALLALLSLTASAQKEIRDYYEELYNECRSDSSLFGIQGTMSIQNSNGRRYKHISIVGMDLNFEPKRDADGNVIEYNFNPDTLKGADKLAYSYYAGARGIRSKIEHILQSSRLATDELYWWEKHQDGKDSMLVSLAYKNKHYSGLPLSFAHNGHTSYKSAEVANYSYVSKDKATVIFDRLYYKGNFSLRYYCLLDSVATELVPFDAEAYRQSILHLLKDKRVVERPVSWIHDESYIGDSPSALELYVSVFKTTGNKGTRWAGNTTGIIYTLRPKKDGDEAAIRRIMEQFLNLTAQYVNAHPEQNYIYHPSICVSDLAAEPKTIVAGSYALESKPEVLAAHDDEGYHILLLQTEGGPWIPRHYSTLKSIHNDKEVFLKGKEPKKTD